MFIQAEIYARDVTSLYLISGEQTESNLTIKKGGKVLITDDTNLKVTGDLVIESGGELALFPFGISKINNINITVDNNVRIAGTINLAGKNGIDGNNGTNKGEAGENGSVGGNGKNLQLVVGKDFYLSGLIRTQGGKGGNAGKGNDDNSISDKPGNGGDGGTGGIGGTITVYVINGQYYATSSGAIISSGGEGGAGGAGGDNGWTGDYGYNGRAGNGGNAGKIEIKAKRFSNSGSITSMGGEPGARAKRVDGALGPVGRPGSPIAATIKIGYETNRGTINPTPSIIEDTVPPNVPTGLKLRSFDKYINNNGYSKYSFLILEWNPSTDLGDPPSDIQEYYVQLLKNGKKVVLYQNTVVGTEINLKGRKYDFKSGSYVPTSLGNGSYSVSVKAIDYNGKESGFSSTFNFTLDTHSPTRPDLLDVSDITPNSVVVNWKTASDTNLSGYEIEWNGGASFTQNQTTNISYSHTFSKLEPNTEYSYRIRAYDLAKNYSTWNSDTVGTAASPASISSILTDYESGHYYADVQIVSNGNDATEYRVWRKKSNQSKWTLHSDWFAINKSQGEIYTYKDVNMGGTYLEAHESYDYKVDTRNFTRDIITDSGPVKTVQVANNQPTFNGIISSANGIFNVNQVQLKIKPFQDLDNDSLTYKFVLKYKNADDLYRETSGLDLSTLSVDHTRVSISAKDLPEGEYLWFVEVRDNYGIEGDATKEVTTTDYYFTIDMTPPDVPTFDIPSYTKDRNVTIKNIRFDHSMSKDTQTIEVWEGNILIDSFSPVSMKQITLTQNGGAKQIHLVAIDDAGNERESADKKCIYDIQEPDNPASIDFSSGDGSVTISWDEPADHGVVNGISGIKEYELSYKRMNQPESEFSASVTITNIERSYTVADLEDNEPIQARIKTVDYAGNIASNWFVEQDLGYSKPEKAVIQDHQITPARDGESKHTITLNLKETVSAEALKLCYIIESEIDSKNPSATPVHSLDWVTELTDLMILTTQVDPHEKYQYWVVTRNGDQVEVPSTVYHVEIPNYEPINPVINSADYQIINQLPVTLRTNATTDADLDPLSYYFTIYDEYNNPIIENQISNVENDPLAYQVPDDKLEDGKKYYWKVGVSDDNMWEDLNGEDIDEERYIYSNLVESIVDLSEPTITLTPSNSSPAGELTIQIDVVDETSHLESIRYKWNEKTEQVIFPDTKTESFSFMAIHGDNKFSIKAKDEAGHETNWVVRNYVVDLTGPEVENLTITGQVVGSEYYSTKANQVHASWSFLEDVTSIDYYRYTIVEEAELSQLKSLDSDRFKKIDQDTLAGDFDATFSSSLIENSRYYFVVEAVNTVNRSSGFVVSSNGVLIDSTPPVITGIELNNVIESGDKNYINDLQKLTVSSTITDAGSGVNIGDEQYALVKQVGQFSTDVIWYDTLDELKTSVIPVNGDTNFIAIRAQDHLGHVSIGYSEPLIIDQSKPDVNITVGNPMQLDDQNVLNIRPNYGIPVDILIVEETELASIEYSIGTSERDTSISQTLVPDTNGWIALENLNLTHQFDINTSLSDGTYFVNVKVENKAGGERIASSNPIHVDSTIKPVPQVQDQGAYTASNSELYFTWNFSDQSQPVLRYEYQIVDSENTIISDWQEISTHLTGEEQSFMVNHLNLTDGTEYVVKVQAIYEDNSPSGVGFSNGIIVDSTNPTDLIVNDGVYTSGNQLYLEWSASDTESGIVSYQIQIGTTPGGDEISNGWIPLDSSGSGLIQGLTLTHNQLYFVTLKVENGAGLIRAETSNGFRVDNTKPPIPFVQNEGSYTNVLQLTFDWFWSRVNEDEESGTQEYKYALLTEPEVSSNTVWQSAGLETEVTFSAEELVDGERYYLAVKAINQAGLDRIGYSEGILIDTSRPTPPDVHDYDVDYQLSQNSIAGHFTSSDDESNIDYYQYSIGTWDDSDSILSTQMITGEDINITNVSLSVGKTYYITVEAMNKAGLISDVRKSDGLKVIDSYPKITSVTDYGDFTTFNDQIIVSWDCKDNFAPIDHYEVGVSTSQTGKINNWLRVYEKQTIITPKDLGWEKFENGETYYVFIKGVNKADISTPTTELGKTDGIRVDNTPPTKPVITHTDPYTTNNYKLHWSTLEPDFGIAGYRYAIGTTRGGTDVSSGWRRVDSTDLIFDSNTLESFQHNQRYFLSVQAVNLTGLWSDIAYDEGVVADLTPPETPIIEYASNYITSLNQVNNIIWNSDDAETGIIGYRYQLVQSKENINWQGIATAPTTHSELTIDITDLNLIEDEQYYIAIQTQNRLGVWSTPGFSQLLTTDTIDPEINFVNINKEMVTNTGFIDVPWSVSEDADVSWRLIRPDQTTIPTSGYTRAFKSAGDYIYSFAQTLEGTYQLEFYASDPAGNEGTKRVQDIRLNAKPRVNVGADFNVFKGNTITFTADVNDPEDGADVSYLWDFGDGNTSTEASPTYRYLALGEYTVTLTCTDFDQGEGSDTLVVKVTNTTAGSLVEDELWTEDMNITDTVIVPEGVSLTIIPGLLKDLAVNFPADTGLIINGTLIVQGSDGSKVRFTTPIEHNMWSGIKVNSTADFVSLSFAEISRSRRGITLDNKGWGSIDYMLFDQNIVGVHLVNSSPTIKNTTISNSMLYGIKEDGDSSPQLSNNVFVKNRVGDYYDSQLTIFTGAEIDFLY